jgi:ABC-2 type transport system ATP-binding protein
MNDSPILSASGLAKRFGRHEVLSGLDLAVPRGCVLGLVGRNGAGKTTLLRCLLGLARADAGRSSRSACPAGTCRMQRKPASAMSRRSQICRPG